MHEQKCQRADDDQQRDRKCQAFDKIHFISAA
jgi:hypothetical protein